MKGAITIIGAVCFASQITAEENISIDQMTEIWGQAQVYCDERYGNEDRDMLNECVEMRARVIIKKDNPAYYSQKVKSPEVRKNSKSPSYADNEANDSGQNHTAVSGDSEHSIIDKCSAFYAGSSAMIRSCLKSKGVSPDAYSPPKRSEQSDRGASHSAAYSDRAWMLENDKHRKYYSQPKFQPQESEQARQERFRRGMQQAMDALNKMSELRRRGQPTYSSHTNCQINGNQVNCNTQGRDIK